MKEDRVYLEYILECIQHSYLHHYSNKAVFWSL